MYYPPPPPCIIPPNTCDGSPYGREKQSHSGPHRAQSPSIAQCSTMQHSTAQHSTAQYSQIQYSTTTIQYTRFRSFSLSFSCCLFPSPSPSPSPGATSGSHFTRACPRPVTNRGTMGALQPAFLVRSAVVHLQSACVLLGCHALSWSALVVTPPSLCFLCVTSPGAGPLFPCCCGVSTSPFPWGWWLSAGHPAALVTHHVCMVPEAAEFGAACLRGATCSCCMVWCVAAQ